MVMRIAIGTEVPNLDIPPVLTCRGQGPVLRPPVAVAGGCPAPQWVVCDGDLAMAPIQSLRNGPPSALVAPVLALAALGALVVIPLVVLAAIPVLLAVVITVGGLVAFGLGVWALIEGLAAFERWLETDPRFHR
jgi:hypothetical protein